MSEHQAELLRRVAAGEPLNEPPDWANIIEELEDVGRSELRSCRSLLRQALRHMLKAEAWPLSRDAPTCRADAIDFRNFPCRISLSRMPELLRHVLRQAFSARVERNGPW
ncbi:MAG: DUF29 family protein [Rhodopila sp.]